MSDDDTPDLDPGLDPRRDAEIRALLADLGSGPEGESMPPEVLARLDQTVARLSAERAATGDAGDVGDVEELSRRRRLPRALAVAAAVVVIGAGAVTAANLGRLGGDSADSKAGGSVSADSQAESAPEPASPTPGTDPQESQDGQGSVDSLVGLPVVRSGSFAADVSRLLASGAVDPLDDSAKQGPRASTDISCAGPPATQGARTAVVRYDGAPAVLVIHPVRDGKRLVEAWGCDGVRVLDRTRVATGAGSPQD